MALLEKSFKYGEKSYTMREMIGEEDLAFQSEFLNPITNKINMRNLWMRRLSRCIVSPPMPESELVKLPAKELQTLTSAWSLMNEIDNTSFLELSTVLSGDIPSSSSTKPEPS